jgi:hypothetical protein
MRWFEASSSSSRRAHLGLDAQHVLVERLHPLAEFFHRGVHGGGKILVVFQPQEHALHPLDHAVDDGEAPADVEQLAAFGRRGRPGHLRPFAPAWKLLHQLGMVGNDRAYQQIQRAFGGVMRGCRPGGGAECRKSPAGAAAR